MTLVEPLKVVDFDVEALLSRCRFPTAGTPLDCAVSGGPDSTALLALAVASGCLVTAFHVDHGLRPGSAAEAGVVAANAARLGAAFEARQAVVSPGSDLEARARAARFAVLPEDVATGHTLDDQAETVLLNLLRGSGLDGVAAMRPGPRHPILALRRVETHGLCESMSLETVSDPSNHDPAFRRNRVRHEVVPLLDDVAGRDVSNLLARSAQVAADDINLLDELASELDPECAADLAGAHVALARRAVRSWLRVHLDGYPPDAATVERVLEVARLERRAADVTRGLEVRRTAGRLRLGPAE